MKRLPIALADDHAVVRHGLASRLRAASDFVAVGACGRSSDAMRGLEEMPEDLLLPDFAHCAPAS